MMIQRILNKFNCNSLSDLFIKIKWILSQSKPVIPFLITTIIINSLLSLVSVYNALVSKSLIDSAINGETQNVIKWLIIMALIMLSNILVNPITSFMNTHASMNLTQNLQKHLYKHIEYSDWLSQSKFHSVSLLTRVTSDVNTISSMLLNTVPSIVTLLVTLIASFSTLIFLSSSLAVIAIFIAPILFIVSKLLGRKLNILYKQIQNEDVKYRSFMQESLQNIMIVKTFCMEKLNLEKLKQIQKNKYNLAMKNTKFSALTGISMNLCSSMAYFTIFCWGVINISKGTSTYGTFTAMLELYSKVQYPISSLASMFPTLVAAVAAAERLMDLENLPLEPEIQNNNSAQLLHPSIHFDNVSFEYAKNKPILKNVNLNIQPGEIIALVGNSGEGKTTIIRLLLYLLKVNSGNITFSYNNINESINPKDRELISYVPQGNTLFSGSIEENLKYGNADASIEQINEALKKSCAIDFVNGLDDGIKTVIGEKGLGISEGQAQRIAIARSFLREKPILILDEATSSLDPETEINVLKSIKHISYKPTCIIITHRPSALNICNRIYKISNGNLFEISKDAVLEIANELN